MELSLSQLFASTQIISTFASVPLSGFRDGVPLHLERFDATPCLHVNTITAETHIPLATLRQWERKYGFPVAWSEEERLWYSERDRVALQWLAWQVTHSQSIQQALRLFVQMEPSYASPQCRHVVSSALPAQKDLRQLYQQMLQGVIASSRTQAASVLSQAIAIYPMEIVCDYLLQPVLISATELYQKNLLSSMSLSLLHVIIRSLQPSLIEICLTPEQAEQYLQRFISRLSNIPSQRLENWRKTSQEEQEQSIQKLLTVIRTHDETNVQHYLASLFSNYPAEAVCLHLLPHVCQQLETEVALQKLPPRTLSWGMQLLTQFLHVLLAFTPDISSSSTIVIANSRQELSDCVTALLALCWRRAGYHVSLIEHMLTPQTLRQAFSPSQPTLLYLSGSSPETLVKDISLQQEIQNLFADSSPLLCFGGHVWKKKPELLRQLPGFYLGTDLAEVVTLGGELARLLPTLTPSQLAMLRSDNRESSAPQIAVSASLGHDKRLLVGCVPLQNAEFEALRLALFWYRLGLQVIYVGQIPDEQVLMGYIHTYHPWLVFLSATSRISIHWITRLGRAILNEGQKEQPLFSFGGEAFTQMPHLARNLPGLYLGTQPGTISLQLAKVASLAMTLSPEQIAELLAPNSFRSNFQQEMQATRNVSSSFEKTAVYHAKALATTPLSPPADRQRPAQSPAINAGQPQSQLNTKAKGGWKGTPFYPGSSEIRQALPGLVYVVLPLALLAEGIWILELQMHATFFVDIFIAAVLALLLGNSFTIPERMQAGLTFSTRWCLRLGILLYALKFSYRPLLQSGLQNFIIVLCAILLALGIALIGGRLLTIHPRIAALIGTGTGICGISAVLATSPAIEARDEETAVALGTILCWGTAGLLFYPLIGHVLHLSPTVYGAWTGATIHDLPQLIATAQQGGGTAALKAALLVKLIRVTFIVLIVLTLSISFQLRNPGLSRGTQASLRLQSLIKTFPLFVVGFFLIVVTNTISTIPGWLTGPLATWPTTTFPTTLSSFLLMLAVIGICVRINRSAIKIAGLKALILGLLVWSMQSIGVLFIVRLLIH